MMGTQVSTPGPSTGHRREGVQGNTRAPTAAADVGGQSSAPIPTRSPAKHSGLEATAAHHARHIGRIYDEFDQMLADLEEPKLVVRVRPFDRMTELVEENEHLRGRLESLERELALLKEEIR